ncbi:MAG: aldehyde dehydrogenase EutE [Candidatus Cloacimonadota bacterium]|nr:MAG: aldehyde dehydrogenase EutE [Candidatus Cloacimonadota bacterium]
MDYSSDDIARIVSRVVEQLDRNSNVSSTPGVSLGDNGLLGCYQSIDECVEKASLAYQSFKAYSLSQRERFIFEIRKICMDNLEALARMAFEETSLGRFEDKVEKNRLVIEKTPGTEDLQPIAYSGDNGLTLVESSAYGVIGAITPTTNPTETIINNSIGMIAAGNSVVFNPHPRARRSCAYAVHLINEAIISCGGPRDLATIMEHPSMESGQELMEHDGIRILVVTGGPGLVKAAAKSGKKVIGAGPGNPPCIVDETADLDAAARYLVQGATLDNNILCIAEKEVFVVESVADEFMQALKRNNAYHVIGANISKLENLIYQDNHMNADFIGKDASFILSHVGIHTDSNIRLAFMEVSNDHFLVHTEQMMPVMPIVRCKDVKEAIDRAIVAEKGCLHTATMHSKNLDNLHEMAVRSEVSIFVKNGPSCAGLGFGGEGFSTMTIAGHTGEGLTSARTYTRSRRCVLKGHFRIV